jgi:8-oxo-dGTP diphosphatase
MGETPRQAVARELFEETGIKAIKNVEFLSYTNDLFHENGGLDKHYVTFFFTAELSADVEAQLLEPGKCAEWRWVDPRDLPYPLFLPVKSLLEQGNGVLPSILPRWEWESKMSEVVP